MVADGRGGYERKLAASVTAAPVGCSAWLGDLVECIADTFELLLLVVADEDDVEIRVRSEHLRKDGSKAVLQSIVRAGRGTNAERHRAT